MMQVLLRHLQTPKQNLSIQSQQMPLTMSSICRRCLAQSYGASKCLPILPELRAKILKSRKENLKTLTVWEASLYWTKYGHSSPLSLNNGLSILTNKPSKTHHSIHTRWGLILCHYSVIPRKTKGEGRLGEYLRRQEALPRRRIIKDPRMRNQHHGKIGGYGGASPYWSHKWGGKRLRPMHSEEQVAQSLEYRREILITNMEDDKSTTVDNDVQFEFPLGEVGFIKNSVFRMKFGVVLTKRVWHSAKCPMDTWAGPNLKHLDYLKPQWPFASPSPNHRG